MRLSMYTPTIPDLQNRFCGIKPEHLDYAEGCSVVRLALTFLEIHHKPGEALTSPERAFDYLRLKLVDRKVEVFGCVFLDTRNRVLSIEDLSIGSIDSALVPHRVVAQRALELNASALILYHNHPSGMPEPGEEDKEVTSQLKRVLKLLEIRLLDHVVVGIEGYVSFVERGWI